MILLDQNDKFGIHECHKHIIINSIIIIVRFSLYTRVIDESKAYRDKYSHHTHTYI